MNPVPLVAVVGNPNAGKSALFNALTGARQKVGNYPGVTVERHVGRPTLPDGRPVELVDLPGAYGLDPTSPDEAVTRDVLLGKQEGERLPDALLIVVDASNLDNHLRFALQLIELGLPTVVALNMIDLAKRDGLELDAAKLEQELGVPVVETVAVRKRGLDEIMRPARRAAARSRARSAPARVRATTRSTLQRRARGDRHGRDRPRNAGPPHHPPARRGAAASGGRADHPRRDHVRDVPGGLRLVDDPADALEAATLSLGDWDRQRAARRLCCAR